jgi:MSHA biogenesis protein MshI
MKFNWPWKSSARPESLVVACDADHFAYVHAGADGALRRCGVEHRGGDTAQEFTRRLRALNLPSRGGFAMLQLSQTQMIQVDAPGVRPEEMKAAARWRIKDLVDARLDDLTIDVMAVGDERPRTQKQVYVAAAKNSTLRTMGDFARSAGMELSVIDLMETSQRNLLSAVANAHGLGERATAALVAHGPVCLLTICARGELFYTRRLDWDGSGLTVASTSAAPTAPPSPSETLDFVDYGAEAELPLAGQGDAPRIVIELQRSFDVWERSWPDLPLAGLWVEVGEASLDLASALEQALGMQVGVLYPERVFPGWEAAAPTPALRDAVLPLLGALLRTETRQL